jgi:hypothetical protein
LLVDAELRNPPEARRNLYLDAGLECDFSAVARSARGQSERDRGPAERGARGLPWRASKERIVPGRRSRRKRVAARRTPVAHHRQLGRFVSQERQPGR